MGFLDSFSADSIFNPVFFVSVGFVFIVATGVFLWVGKENEATKAFSRVLVSMGVLLIIRSFLLRYAFSDKTSAFVVALMLAVLFFAAAKVLRQVLEVSIFIIGSFFLTQYIKDDVVRFSITAVIGVVAIILYVRGSNPAASIIKFEFDTIMSSWLIVYSVIFFISADYSNLQSALDDILSGTHCLDDPSCLHHLIAWVSLFVLRHFVKCFYLRYKKRKRMKRQARYQRDYSRKHDSKKKRKKRKRRKRRRDDVSSSSSSASSSDDDDDDEKEDENSSESESESEDEKERRKRRKKKRKNKKDEKEQKRDRSPSPPSPTSSVRLIEIDHDRDEKKYDTGNSLIL